jgi:hypothetical protein
VLWGGCILLDVFLPVGATAVGFDFGSYTDMNVTISVTARSGASFSVSRAVVAKASYFQVPSGWQARPPMRVPVG